jgi:parallel beta-helix repeat protein
MKKNHILLYSFLFVVSHSLHATNYFISSLTGNDNTNTGLSVSSPFATIQKAADLTNPGDTVFVMNGTYTNVCNQCLVVTVTRPGTAAKWIVYKNYPNHKPLLQFNAWGGFMVRDNGAYIEINGFTIKGNNANGTLAAALNQRGSCGNPGPDFDPSFNGSGLASDGRGDMYGTGHPHHLRFINNDISECGAAGISCIQSDYVTIENNLIYNNCWYTVFGASGISFYQSWNFDSNFVDHKMIIKNNKLYGNQLMVPWIGCCCISDGNGIIIDDGKNTQNNSPIGRYKGKTLVANNICIKNGGSGIHAYESENTDIINNTTYQNSQSANLGGEIFANTSNNINILNNIMYPISNEAANQIDINYNNTNTVYDYNLYFNTTNIIVNGSHDIKANPNFVNPTLVLATADFHLQTGSGAIDKGTSNKAPLTDYENHVRPAGAGFDIGAYEFASVVLPVNIWPLTAACLNDEIELQWKVFSADNIKSYIIQGSVNGTDWVTLKEINNTTATAAQGYSVKVIYTDKQFYRIGVKNTINIIEKYTDPINFSCAKGDAIFSIYPNPFANAVYLKWNGATTTGKLKLTNASGQILDTKNITLTNGSTTLGYGYLSAGTYFLQFTGDDGKKWVERFVKVK